VLAPPGLMLHALKNPDAVFNNHLRKNESFQANEVEFFLLTENGIWHQRV
jgi:hypothetical protein